MTGTLLGEYDTLLPVLILANILFLRPGTRPNQRW